MNSRRRISDLPLLDCTLDQVLPRAGCSRQFGRASAPMIPHVHPRPEHGHWHVVSC
jgi:hypothetical protein